MPIFEMKCKNCNIVFEAYAFNGQDREPIFCPICKGDLERLISKTTFRLKGNCWAEDGYSGVKNYGKKKATRDSKSS